jgi:hypothetical protein
LEVQNNKYMFKLIVCCLYLKQTNGKTLIISSFRDLAFNILVCVWGWGGMLF